MESITFVTLFLINKKEKLFYHSSHFPCHSLYVTLFSKTDHWPNENNRQLSHRRKELKGHVSLSQVSKIQRTTNVIIASGFPSYVWVSLWWLHSPFVSNTPTTPSMTRRVSGNHEWDRETKGQQKQWNRNDSTFSFTLTLLSLINRLH